MEWADAVVWRAVLSSPSAPSDPDIKSKSHHLHMVQRAFLNTWRETPHVRNAGSDLDILGLARWAQDYYGPASEFLNGVSEQMLDKPVMLPWANMLTAEFGREAAVTNLGETMMQVAAHSTYHRGQINARLRALGDVPPLTDYIAWIWLGKPAAEWPDEAGGQ